MTRGDQQIRRLAVAGGVVSVNPYYLYSRSEFNAPYTGSDRSYTAARLKTLVDASVVTSLHSDTPVTPPGPLDEIWIAVNRFGLSGKVRGPAERVDVDRALRMVTIDAAYTLGVEDRVGSIEAGTSADFTVVESDPHRLEGEDPRHRGLGYGVGRSGVPRCGHPPLVGVGRAVPGPPGLGK